MRASRFLFATLRETPNDAEVISHQLQRVEERLPVVP